MLYSALRDFYQKPLLLESSDYNVKEGHYSYICLNPFAEISISDNKIVQKINNKSETMSVLLKEDVLNCFENFRMQFEFEKYDYKFCYAGLFGYTGYDAIKYYEDIIIDRNKSLGIPEIFYAMYSIMLVFEHATDSLYLISHNFDDEAGRQSIFEIEQRITVTGKRLFPFEVKGEFEHNLRDAEYIKLVEIAKNHCRKGDVFQLVLSKRFSIKFRGDEFNVYRTLRNINPSPYLFYFDFGNFKLFGSSPEAQLIKSQETIEIHPIAGTYKRTGNDTEDLVRAQQLIHDAKEKSEHLMLVDLARNDLSKYCQNVEVSELMQTQFFSHVIHLVSKVKGKQNKTISPFEILLGTFPAGTLTGAPKHKAMQLINTYEPEAREFYGGCVGYISVDNSMNHAIMIRTFISKDYTLHYQAGAGTVISSDPVSENQEIYNKVNALQKAMINAEKINNITKESCHEIISVR